MLKNEYFKIRGLLDFSISPRFIIQTLLIQAVLFCSIYAIFKTSYFYLNILLIPVFLFRSFGILHEAVHNNVAENKILNDVIGLLMGCFCFLPYFPWVKLHLAHHKWSGNTEQDPTLLIVKEFDSKTETIQDLYNFFWKSKIPVLAFMQHFVFWIQSFKVTTRAGIKNISLNTISALGPAVTWFFVVHNLNTPQRITFFAAACCYLGLVEIVNFPHHVGKYVNSKKPLFLWEQPETTRTCRYSKFFEEHIILNFNFHNEHHLFPDLPANQLRDAHTALIQKKHDFTVDYNSNWVLSARRENIDSFMQKPTENANPVLRDPQEVIHPLM